MPDIRFTFLLCSYLPGLPLATIFYWLFLGGSYGNGHNDYFVLYFLVVPLLIGLFIDGLRHTVEEILRVKKYRRFEKLFWVDLSLDKIPRIIEKGGRESLARYERTEEKLYFMYEHFWNTWISSVFTLVIILFYHLITGKSILDNTPMIFFAVIMVVVFLSYGFLAKTFRAMLVELADEITGNGSESRLESKSEQ